MESIVGLALLVFVYGGLALTAVGVYHGLGSVHQFQYVVGTIVTIQGLLFFSGVTAGMLALWYGIHRWKNP